MRNDNFRLLRGNGRVVGPGYPQAKPAEAAGAPVAKATPPLTSKRLTRLTRLTGLSDSIMFHFFLTIRIESAIRRK
jgi:hypothetical protein